VGNAQLIGQREYQNDYFSTLTYEGCFLAVIADGLTDKPAAKTAAIITVDTLRKNFKLDRHIHIGFERYVKESLYEVQKMLRAENYANITGATLIAMLIRDGIMHFASLGDCSLFIYRRHELMPLNRTYSTMMEIKRMALDKKDIAILCSKGARESLTEMEIIWQMEQKIHPYSKCQNLISLIRSKSLTYQDNATIVVAEKMLQLPGAARG